jgi:hypothetical protein
VQLCAGLSGIVVKWQGTALQVREWQFDSARYLLLRGSSLMAKLPVVALTTQVRFLPAPLLAMLERAVGYACNFYTALDVNVCYPAPIPIGRLNIRPPFIGETQI